MESTSSNVTLTAGQLVALVRPVQSAIGVLSPLRIFDRAALADSSVTLPESITRDRAVWEPAARTLADPKLALVVSAGTSESVVFLHAFGSPATHDHLVGCTNAQNGTFDIVPSMTTSSWSQVLWTGLTLDTVPPTPDAALSMSVAALRACCGLVDAIKEARLEALIARNAYPASCATTASIALSIKTGLITQDSRWFTGLVRRLLPEDPGEPGLEQTRQGLQELVQLGWVTQASEDEWSFSEVIQPHAIEWSAASVSGLFSLHLDDPDGPNRLHVGLIRTLSGLWTLECPPPGDTVKIGRTGGEALMLIMMKAVESLLAPWHARPAPSNRAPGTSGSPASRRCPSCGAEVGAEARFCSNCGKPVPPPEVKPVCPGCGNPVHPGEKFCHACGHRIA